MMRTCGVLVLMLASCTEDLSVPTQRWAWARARIGDDVARLKRVRPHPKAHPSVLKQFAESGVEADQRLARADAAVAAATKEGKRSALEDLIDYEIAALNERVTALDQAAQRVEKVRAPLGFDTEHADNEY